jgi:hypothetical protein
MPPTITITSVVKNQVFFETTGSPISVPFIVNIDAGYYVFETSSSPGIIPPSIYNSLLNTGFGVVIFSHDSTILSNDFSVSPPLVPLTQPGIHFLLY